MLSTYELVKQLNEPRWISLTAPTGWGKTRLVQEFYAELAGSQTGKVYWPIDLFRPQPNEGVLSSRKRVSNSFDHVAGAEPTYVWWGIACSLSKSPVGNFAAALAGLAAHAPYLDRAWRRRATASEKAARALSGLNRELEAEGVTEAVRSAVSAAAGVDPLGLGLAWWLGGRAKALISDRRSSRRLVARHDVIEADAQRGVDEALALIARLGKVGLPIVIAVEDAHLIDVATARLLERLLGLAIPALIVTTQVDLGSDSLLCDAMWSREDRIIELAADVTPLSPFPRQLSIPNLSEGERSGIVRARFADISESACAQVAARYTNPLAIELFCELPKFEVVDGLAMVSPTEAEIDAAPRSIRDMYRVIWNDFSIATRRHLHLGALLSPFSIDARLGVDRSWSLSVARKIATTLGPSTTSDFDASIEPALGRWISRGGDGMINVLEPDQYDIALEDTDLLSQAAVQDSRVRLARIVEDTLQPGATEDPAELWSISRTALALDAMGIRPEPDTLAHAGLWIANSLIDFERSVDEALEVTSYLCKALPPGDALRLAHLLRARCLAMLGRGPEAVDELERIVLQLAGKGAERELRIVRVDLAGVLREMGRAAQAIEILREVIAATPQDKEESRVVLQSRLHLAMTLQDVGEIEAAARELGSLLSDPTFDSVDDPVWVLGVQANQASILWDLGLANEAINLWRQTITTLTGMFGPEHPLTLMQRSNLAAALSVVDPSPRIIQELREIAITRTRVLGPSHPASLNTRTSLADALDESGETADALDEYRTVIAESTRKLGAEHPNTLLRRNNAAIAIQRSGDLQGAADELAEVLEIMVRVLVPGHPRIRETQYSLDQIREDLNGN